MDITSILSMHQELSLIAVFLLTFVMDLFLPEEHRYLARRGACIALSIHLVLNLVPNEVVLFGGMYHCGYYQYRDYSCIYPSHRW